ncbi:MAG: hypothetical protein ACK6BG_09180 [Cyanobacteriota bacterium]
MSCDPLSQPSTWNRILFVCGAIHQQKSGVADYVLALAQELVRRGFEPSCVSLHEPLADDEGGFARKSLNGIPVLCCSSSLSWDRRAALLQQEIQTFQPDWMSLQYVPYAFHSKGLPHPLIRCLSSPSIRARWHVFAHELWVDPTAGLPDRILSKVQREILRLLLRRLKPSVVHTTNFWYRNQLRSIGQSADVLPLFSNIGLVPMSPSILGQVSQGCSVWRFLLFGSINKEWRPETLLQAVKAAQLANDIDTCHFVSVGHLASYAVTLWDAMAESCSDPSFMFSRLGELSPEQVSQQMQLADFGIGVTPSHLIGKSASAAAMLSHGLPIIIDRLTDHCDEWHQHLKSSGKYILVDSSFPEQMASATKFESSNCLAEVADQFVKSLQAAM